MSRGFVMFDIVVMIVLTTTVSLLVLSAKNIDGHYNDIKLEYEEKERERVEEYHKIERCEECFVRDTF